MELPPRPAQYWPTPVPTMTTTKLTMMRMIHRPKSSRGVDNPQWEVDTRIHRPCHFHVRQREEANIP
eukprot:scaffold43944_cov59-Attheya_sp.AAC.13